MQNNYSFCNFVQIKLSDMQVIKFTHGGKPYRLEGDKLIREAYNTTKTDFEERPLVPKKGPLGIGYYINENFLYLHQLKKLAK